MKKVSLMALAIFGAALVLGFASCSNASGGENAAPANNGTPTTQTTEGGGNGGSGGGAGGGGSIVPAQAALTIDGTALQMTGEVLVPGNTIVGKANTNNDPGVFIEGRTVTLSSFIMGKYEVTQELYKKVMTGNPLGVSAEASRFTDNPEIGEKQEWRPVDDVSWFQAVYFCNELTKKTLGESEQVYSITNANVNNGRITATVAADFTKKGYRLPTEVEWEFAARGGNPDAEAWDYTYSGAPTASGTDWSAQDNAGMDNVGWYRGNSGFKTHQVGKKPTANALGLYDMSGNVVEWCWDFYNKIDSNTALTGPGAWPDVGNRRVFRGGGCDTDAYHCSIAVRNVAGSGNSSYYGFRVVRNAQ